MVLLVVGVAVVGGVAMESVVVSVSIAVVVACWCCCCSLVMDGD